jgi:hypothetical protein
MADLVISYQALNNAATQLTNIESESDAIDKAMQIGEGTRTNISAGYIPSSSGSMSPYTLGPGNLPSAMSDFYRAWADPFHNALDQLKQLASTFTGVAQAWFDADATQAAGINSDLAQSNLTNYDAELAQYNANPPSPSDYAQALASWEEQLLQIMTSGLSPAQMAYQLTALGGAPQPEVKPTDPGTTLTTGNTTTTLSANGAPYAPDTAEPTSPTVTSETTTVSVDGMTLTETTTFDPPKGYVNGQLVQNWTQTVTNADGSKDTTTAVAGLDGSISETTKDSSGTVTSTATRANWNAPWVYTDDSNDNGNSGSGDSGGESSWMQTWDGGA